MDAGGTGNWFYNTAYATITSPKRPLPRTGDVALHGIGQYTSQLLVDTFVEGRTYTFSVYCSGDADAAGNSDRCWFYIFDGDAYPGAFAEGNELVRARFINDGTVDSVAQPAGTGAVDASNEGWSIGTNPGDWVGGGGTWGKATLSYTATATDAGKRIGIAFWGGGDAAIDDVTVISDVITSQPPVVSPEAAGPATTVAGTTETFNFTATDPEGDDVEIQADWGNGQLSPYTTAGPSGVAQMIDYAYPGAGAFTIRARARDSNGAVSDWVEIQSITVDPFPPAPLVMAGLWEFNNPANLGEATVGNDLTVGGTFHTHSASLADDNANSQDGVVTTEGTTTSFFSAAHDIPANGGGSEVNQYSVVMDLFSPSAVATPGGRSSRFRRDLLMTMPTTGSRHPTISEWVRSVIPVARSIREHGLAWS